MKIPLWKPRLVETYKNFNIILDFLEDDKNPRDHFINECRWTKEQYNKIKNNYFFCACIEVYKGNVLCGSSYLGACCYKNLDEVLGDKTEETILSGYYKQLRDEAIEEAEKRLAGDLSNFVYSHNLNKLIR